MARDSKKTPRVDLTPRERQVAALIAAGSTHAEAAAVIGRSAHTVSRLAIRADVRQAIDGIRHSAIEAGLGKLCEGFRSAVDVLVTLTANGTPADSIKLGAARAVVDSVLKVREQVELARRIAALESERAPS
jgi:hypothetical protein